MPRKLAHKPPEIAAAEDSFYRCPGGHKLPNETNAGQCTPLFCAGKTETNRKKKQKEEVALAKRDLAPLATAETTLPSAEEQRELAKASESRRISNAAGRFAARMGFLSVPEFKDPKEAEEWSDRKLVELLPLAVAEKEMQLKYGDDKQRDKAADDILAANGRGKRDVGGNSGPAIVILAPGGQLKAPWSQRVIDAEVVSDEKK